MLHSGRIFAHVLKRLDAARPTDITLFELASGTQSSVRGTGSLAETVGSCFWTRLLRKTVRLEIHGGAVSRGMAGLI